MNTQDKFIESVEFLESIMAGAEERLLDRLEAFAAHLGVPVLWINQLFQSTLHQQTNDFMGACRLACALIHFILKEEDCLPLLRQHLEEVYGEQVVEIFDDAANYMTPFCGKMHSYYDLYASANCPEILGKPDDWVWQESDFPTDVEICTEADNEELNLDGHVTVRDIKCYIRTTVPLSKHLAVFGEAA